MKKFHVGLTSAMVILAIPMTSKAIDTVRDDEIISAITSARAAYPGITEEQYAAFKKLPDSHFDRKIATTGGLYEKEMSAGYRAMGERIRTKVKTADDLAALIEEFDSKYDTYKDADLKLLALETAQLKPLRGIIYKLIPLVEAQKMAHSMLLSKMLKLATRMGIYSPTTQNHALMAYLTEPYDGMVRFKVPYDFQHYVATNIYKATWNSTLRLRDLDLTQRSDGKGGGKLVVDNSVFYSGVGTGKYQDPNSQYNFFQEGERQILMAAKNRTMKDQMAFISFNIEMLMDLTAEMGKLYGKEMANANVVGASTKSVHDVLAMPKYAKMFTMFPSVGVTAMDNVRFHTVQMVYHLGQAWKALKEDHAKIDLSGMINPAVANAFTDQFEDVLPAWEIMIKGEHTLVSKTTGDRVTVNIPRYYAAFTRKDPSAADLKARDLKNFLPNHFRGTATDPNCTEENRVKKGYLSMKGLGEHERLGVKSKKIHMKDEKGKDVEVYACYHDYAYGSPDGWDEVAYSTIYPGLKDGSKVDDYQRTLKQSNGGRLVANLIDWVID